jgi:4-amino-4-deoxy-L-arabinose transferase-like glycosyltransferase
MIRKKKSFIFNVLDVDRFEFLAIIVVIFLYTAALLSVITWGIPNVQHPFTYYMDEWHQLAAVRGVFKYFSNNIPGAAHGPMFQFLLTGIYLIPFYFLHIINPFLIKTAFVLPTMQQKLFLILRLNSLIFGILSIIILYKIAKQYLKVPTLFTILLFTATPIWISLSNYFKYDIALIFWILLSILWLFKYRDKPISINYFIAGALCGLALATKISALPFIPIYLASYFLFTKRKKWRYSIILKGFIIFFLVFCTVGIPDVLMHFRKVGYLEFFNSNLVVAPHESENLILPLPPAFFLIFKQYPILFGHGFFLLLIFSIMYGFFMLVRLLKHKQLLAHKSEIFIFLCFFFFAASLVVLKLASSGNRSLVLLPFFVLFCSLVIKSVFKNFPQIKLVTIFLLTIILGFQIIESFSWLSMKLYQDPRETASAWIVKNIQKGNTIGLENIPIYQMIPDLVLKEFYIKQNYPKKMTFYNYVVLDKTTKKLPHYIIITAADFYATYYKNSSKKQLLSYIEKQGYKQIKYFPPNLELYKFFGDELNFYIPNLVPQSSITIYQR